MQRAGAGGVTGIQKAAELIAQARRSVGDVTALTEAKQDFVRLIAEFERITDMLR
ncbi:hypothetical protein [Paenibacillus taihuensis]|uniref:hypothetical protein n=1 Tax=Paenibacillus taihuensis TaxID=1156355 RepID=UPI001FE2B092|nr:hypothetical protein [Paenibacillus taihuensis]